jgi:periplasmic divalent cation tolerance protein
MPPRRAVQVQFTIDDLGRGRAIADAVLDARLAACVQRIGPIRSRYRWEGRLEEAEEWLFLCKTTVAAVDALTARIAELHPYATPEVLVSPVDGGLDRYLAWIAAEVPAAAP